MRGPRAVARVGGSLLLGLVCLAAPADAQQVADLDRVASLSADGRAAEARSTLQKWWDARWSEASSRARQRALWLRASLTVDASLARKDYTRLVLEHPGGPYSGDALLRLAREADVAGRPVAAARHYEQVFRQYPDSPQRLEARRWLDEHREEVARARRTGNGSGEPEADSAGPDDRGAEDATATGDGSSEAAGDSGARAAEGPVTVQLGAFSTVDRARTLLRSARSDGIADLRLVRVEGSDLVRVRAGRFPSRESAAPLRSRIEDREYDAVIVTDADREKTIR